MERGIAAVLAGGRGRRIGRSKAHLEIAGRTFLEHTVAALLGAFERVYVCGGDNEVPGSVLLDDPEPGAGPLAGILSVLRVAGDAPVFVTAVDMPLLDIAAIRRVSEPEVGSGHARIARVHGRPQPLFGAYHGDLVDLATTHLHSPDRSMMGFVRDAPHLELVDITDGSLRNINTPQDYEALRSGLS